MLSCGETLAVTDRRHGRPEGGFLFMVQMQDVMSKPMPDFREGSIVKGRILEVRPREVLVDIGYKSEGVIPITEFDDVDSLEVGDEVEVLLERLENDEGMVVLSKEKAAYRQNWNKIVRVFEGDGLIKGKVKSVVKGGLMVNIGVEAFLPASQIDVVPPKDLQQFVGNTYDFKIVKLNDDRKNVVLSRREVIEQERSEKRQKFMEGVNVGDRVTGTVKNLTDFGAFIDLDGMDGLLHITDMTWGRLGHPSELLKVGQQLEVVVLDINKEKERVSLGLKQTQKNPWDQIEERFPAGQRVKGKIANLVPYGAFVEIEEGVERPYPCLRTFVDETNHAAVRHSQRRPGSRSRGAGRKQRRAKNFTWPSPARTKSVGRDREEIHHRQHRERQNS
jgi:small subunit ribosomal protein S1